MISDEDNTVILQRRAEQLAEVPVRSEILALREFLFFGVMDRVYALSTEVVSAVIPVTESDITYLPGSPPSVLGVSNVRGRIVPVLDLALLLKADRGAVVAPRLVLVEWQGQSFALMVSSIDGVRALNQDQLRNVPGSWPEEQRNYMLAVTLMGEPILKLEALLANQVLGFEEGEEEA